MSNQKKIERLERAYETLKYHIESTPHVQIEDEDQQLTAIIDSIEKLAYHAIDAIIPLEVKQTQLPKIHFIKAKECPLCHGSGIIIDDSARRDFKIMKCHACGETGLKI